MKIVYDKKGKENAWLEMDIDNVSKYLFTGLL